MLDRGYIKWAPFNSVINSSTIINELERIELISLLFQKIK